MNIPPAASAAPQAASQTPSAHAIASGKDTGDSAPAGFAQALFAAGFSNPSSSLPSALSGDTLLSTVSNRNAKNAKQQPSKESSKDGNKNATVPVTVSLQATLAPPLRILPFSRETENHEHNGRTESSSAVTLPVETPAPAPQEHAAAGKPEVTPAANADPVRETSKPPAPQNPPAAPSGDMAFAARVQPATTATAEPGPAPRPLQHDVTAPEQVKKAAEKDTTDATVVQPVAAGADASLTSQGQHAYANPELAPAPAASTTEPAHAAPVRPVEAPVPETQAKPAAGPLKDISLQLSQPGDQKVEVRMVQQSGELHVAVHTGDSDLAHGMQQGLPELVGRLQDNGFHTEAWRPGGSVAQSGPVLETRSSQSGSHNGDSQSNSGGSHQQQGERRQNPSQRPGWVDELESSIAGGQLSQAQGTNYGIGS